MFATLLWVLTPLFLGFTFYLKNRHLLKLIDEGLMLLIYLILFAMGLNLSVMDNLLLELGQIVGKTTLYIMAILGANMLFFFFLDRTLAFRAGKSSTQPHSYKELLLSTTKLFLSLLLGLFVGLGLQWGTILNSDTLTIVSDRLTQLILMALLFFVGLQLRGSGIHLKAVFFNRYGLLLSFTLILSSFIGGVLAATLLGDSLITGLAIASGFGWYSLSAILLQEGFGATVGSIAFFNDLAREFFAFAIIPLMMRRYPLSAIGSGGATALDMTLPLIQQTGGIKVVPVAISFSFIINIVAPIFLAFFATLGNSISF